MIRISLVCLSITLVLPSLRGQEPGPIRLGLGWDSDVRSCNPGPWGELDYYPTILEAPDHVVEFVPSPSERTSWFFPGKSLEQIKSLFREAALSPDLEALIFDASLSVSGGPPYRLYPPVRVIDNLTPLNREVIYRELRRWSENRYYHEPIIIESGDVRSWFEGAALSSETVSRIERYAYRIGRSTAFSDVSAVMSGIGTDAEERAFLKALTRTRALVLRLRVTPDSDTEALKDYWSAGHKKKDILPFFESISYTPGIERVDAIHLVPPGARKHLNTFPSLSLGISGQFPGSFWTTLNFTRYRPLPDFDDEEYARAWLAKFYDNAIPPLRYGDILLYQQSEESPPFHACIYIADDIVYTKNGRSVLEPFMLMKIDDLQARLFPESDPVMRAVRPIEDQ